MASNAEEHFGVAEYYCNDRYNDVHKNKEGTITNDKGCEVVCAEDFAWMENEFFSHRDVWKRSEERCKPQDDNGCFSGSHGEIFPIGGSRAGRSEVPIHGCKREGLK